MTCGAAELTSLAGTLDHFARAAEVVLPKMSGLRSPNRLWSGRPERSAPSSASPLRRKPSTVRPPVGLAPRRRGPDLRLRVDLLTGVAKQGPGAAAAEGEMVAVGMVYNPVPEDRQE